MKVQASLLLPQIKFLEKNIKSPPLSTSDLSHLPWMKEKQPYEGTLKMSSFSSHRPYALFCSPTHFSSIYYNVHIKTVLLLQH